MNAVDWWKTQRREAPAIFLRGHVQWICVKIFGKNERVSSTVLVTCLVSTKRPRFSLAMFTRSSQRFRVTKNCAKHPTWQESGRMSAQEINLEFARQYAADGWDVIATSRNAENAAELQQL